MRFAAEHHFPAPPAAVAAVLLDPAFHAHLDLPDLGPPEVLAAGPTMLRLRYEFVGQLEVIARTLLAGRRLTWVQELELDAASGRGTLSFAAEADPRRLAGSAAVVLDPDDAGGTRRSITGDLQVRVPVVGATAERRIVPGLLRRLDIEAVAIVARLAS